MATPLTPPKLSMGMIPLAVIAPTLSRWNHDSFPPIQIEKGKTAPWLDVYFTWTHPKVPILSPQWVYENYQDLPLFLIHAMYALALTYPVEGEVNYNAGDYHYACCKILHEDNLLDPNPFTVMATYLMGIYALSSTDALHAGISNVSLAIRLAQQMKLGSRENFTWVSPRGRMLGTDEGSGKTMWRLLWYSMYQNDYYYAFTQKIPFIMHEEPLDLIQLQENTVMTYSPFYTSGIWHFYYELLTIARKIAAFIWKDNIDMGDVQWNHEKLALIRLLEQWFQSTPLWFQKPYSNYSYDMLSISPPPWVIAHIKIFYFHLHILLHRSVFMYLVEQGADRADTHSAFQDTITYSQEITKVIRQFLEHNSKFVQGCPYLFYGVHLAASSLCMAIPCKGRIPELIDSITVLIQSMEVFSTTVPVLKVRANMIKEWVVDPLRVTPLYAHII
jgi:hypothetical protein